ncbi:MAG TPA: KEOPS complex subunit Pcc1 [Candidatus Thermoplasmatota archaeon]|nr:KEOPS complex subunit Pcc1 [Candidatus Thermoplasmatota archaeon]
MHTLRLELECPDPATARAVRDAVAIESQDGPGGARTWLGLRGAFLVVEVEAEEDGSLKAAAHGTLRLAEMALRALAR